jgi:hypothetical protein
MTNRLPDPSPVSRSGSDIATNVEPHASLGEATPA